MSPTPPLSWQPQRESSPAPLPPTQNLSPFFCRHDSTTHSLQSPHVPSQRSSHTTILPRPPPQDTASTDSSPWSLAGPFGCGLACCSASAVYSHPLLTLPAVLPAPPRSSSPPASETSASSSSAGPTDLATPACPAYLHPFLLTRKSPRAIRHAFASTRISGPRNNLRALCRHTSPTIWHTMITYE